MLVPAAVTCWLYKQGGGRQVAVLAMAPRTTLLVPLLCLGAAALAAAVPMLFTEEEGPAMGPEPEQTKPRPSALMAGRSILLL